MQGKKILLAVCGSIAAYKTAFLTRLLIKAGAEVQIVMTDAATKFITPLTLSTLSKRPVYTAVTAEESWNNHVELGLWADAMIIAPTTATTLGKLANGICDSMVVATYLSARCPVFFAPAMDLDMWAHPATQRCVQLLQSFGNHLIPVGNGELASGLSGDGRMAEPEDIVAHVERFLARKKDFAGKKVVLTAGPTYEQLDPVRFIGNHSTGKMGVALALNLAARGAEVVLVLGPSKLQPEHANLTVINVQSAEQMHAAATKHFKKADAAILAAAVADFRPKNMAKEKIKKQPGQTEMTLHLEKTPDIAAALGAAKKKPQIVVGFALETQNPLENARKKLKKKNFDFIVLNSLKDKGAGFGHDTNKVTLVYANNKIQEFKLKTKVAVAEDIVAALLKTMNE